MHMYEKGQCVFPVMGPLTHRNSVLVRKECFHDKDKNSLGGY